jgi:hypothetical protein
MVLHQQGPADRAVESGPWVLGHACEWGTSGIRSGDVVSQRALVVENEYIMWIEWDLIGT